MDDSGSAVTIRGEDVYWYGIPVARLAGGKGEFIHVQVRGEVQMREFPGRAVLMRYFANFSCMIFPLKNAHGTAFGVFYKGAYLGNAVLAPDQQYVFRARRFPTYFAVRKWVDRHQGDVPDAPESTVSTKNKRINEASLQSRVEDIVGLSIVALSENRRDVYVHGSRVGSLNQDTMGNCVYIASGASHKFASETALISFLIERYNLETCAGRKERSAPISSRTGSGTLRLKLGG